MLFMKVKTNPRFLIHFLYVFQWLWINPGCKYLQLIAFNAMDLIACIKSKRNIMNALHESEDQPPVSYTLPICFSMVMDKSRV